MFMIPILTGGYDKWMSTSKLGKAAPTSSNQLSRVVFGRCSLTAVAETRFPAHFADRVPVPVIATLARSIPSGMCV